MCTNDLIVLHLLGIFIFYFLFFVRKNPRSCDDTEIRTQVPTSEGFEITNRTTGATGEIFAKDSRFKIQRFVVS